MTLSTNKHIFWERPANRHETSWPSLLSCQDVLGHGDQGVEPLAALAKRACPAPGSPAPLHGLAPGPGGRQRHPPGVAALRPTAAPSSSAGVGTFSHATSPGAVGAAPGARAAMPRARAVVGAVGTGLRLSRLVRDGATAIALRGGGAAARSMRGARGRMRPSCVVRDKAWSASMGAGRRGESCLGCRSVTSSPS
jgi:hypothetical protein